MTLFSAISFAAPRFLYLLLVLPPAVLLFWLIWRRVRSVRDQFEMKRFAETSRVRSRWFYLRLATWFLLGSASLILALAQPQLERQTSKPVYRKLNLVFVLDTSLSMRARDINPSRLQRAAEEIRDLLLRGSEDIGQVGLVGFSGSSTILSYLTRDPSNILFYLDHLEADRRLSFGTDIGAAIRNALTLIEKEQQLQSSLQSGDFLLILISDGEDHGGLLRQMVDESMDRGVRIYALGLGSRAGGHIPIGERQGETVFLVDERGRRVLATFAEGTLRGIAARTGGSYYRSHSGAELRKNLRDILAMERRLVATRTVQERHPLYSWFLLAGFLGVAIFLAE